MNLQPWTVIGDQKIECQIPRDDADWMTFEHVDTQVLRIDENGCAKGIAYWASSLKGCAAVMAFDWLELRIGVPILADPNGILTNIQMVGEDGQASSELGQVAQVTRLVHHLDWQECAIRVAHKYRHDAGITELRLCEQTSAPRPSATELRRAA